MPPRAAALPESGLGLARVSGPLAHLVLFHESLAGRVIVSPRNRQRPLDHGHVVVSIVTYQVGTLKAREVVLIVQVRRPLLIRASEFADNVVRGHREEARALI